MIARLDPEVLIDPEVSLTPKFPRHGCKPTGCCPAWLETALLPSRLCRLLLPRGRPSRCLARAAEPGFPGSDAFVKRLCAPSKPSGHLQEVPRAQHRALAKPLDDFARRYPERHQAMARAYQSGAYTMQEIGGYFGVHYAAVSRAVRPLECGFALLYKVENKSNNV